MIFTDVRGVQTSTDGLQASEALYRNKHIARGYVACSSYIVSPQFHSAFRTQSYQLVSHTSSACQANLTSQILTRLLLLLAALTPVASRYKVAEGCCVLRSSSPMWQLLRRVGIAARGREWLQERMS